ncbi:hypothetical protein RMATCC62417_15678 [Rhizopus microsporus]|nr:hypothetical protein RMATCC62417_15678 [Rhizopus microsporus]
MFLFDASENNPYQPGSSRPKKAKSKAKSAEAKAAAKAKKMQQDDMESLQITFYEIESWIEKTSPVLARMTKELDRVSKHFDKGKKKNEQQKIPIDLSSMQWTLTFQPNNSMRLETNIKSVEQLIDAVQKIKLITDSDSSIQQPDEEDFDSTFSSSASLSSSSTAITDSSSEYWALALCRSPGVCFDKYQSRLLELDRLSEQVSSDVLAFACQTYWDCLFPKFSTDWSTFWDRSGDPQRNQICIDAGLAMVFTHIVRHSKEICPDGYAISYYYYERARQSLMDYFDSPDAATIEALLNLAMFCMLFKHYSNTRIYLDLAFRMTVQLGYHRRSGLPTCKLMRKQWIRLFLTLCYNDMALSTYSNGSFLVDDTVHDIDFYELITLNNELPHLDERMRIKDTYFVHLMELMKIHKRIQQMTKEYQDQHTQYHYSGTLPPRWIKKVQALEIALATWLDRLPLEYHLDPRPDGQLQRDTTDIERLKEQSALLLMLHYQMQWIALHKVFLSTNLIPIDLKEDPTTYRTHRSYAICTDAASRILVMAEIFTDRFDWCVCQLFISCIYQASTVFCKSVLTKDHRADESKAMIRRVISILAANNLNYGGLPEDLRACLNEFLQENTNDLQVIDQTLSQESISQPITYNDAFYNSPHMYKQCLNQRLHYQSSSSPSPRTLYQAPTLLPLGMQTPTVHVEDLDTKSTNWRCKFSSSNYAQNHM